MNLASLAIESPRCGEVNHATRPHTPQFLHTLGRGDPARGQVLGSRFRGRANGVGQRRDQAMRLKDKVAIVVGAGQSPGEGMGNGRATVLRFVQEGARVLAVDNRLASAEETAAMAAQERNGECVPLAADVTQEPTLAAMAAA